MKSWFARLWGIRHLRFLYWAWMHDQHYYALDGEVTDEFLDAILRGDA